MSYLGFPSAQMVSPEMDEPGQPFSYFSKPTDEIGVMNAPSATEIGPEGFLYTGFGELMFFTGPEQTPTSPHVRTLKDGDLPILSYTVSHLGIDYRFTMFSAPVDGKPMSTGEAPGTIVNFVRITMHNPGTRTRAAFLTAALRYGAEQTTEHPTGDNRFIRPTVPARVGDYQQPGEVFRADWSYSMQDGACLRDGRALFLYPDAPRPRQSLTMRTQYNRIEPLHSSTLALTPTTPVCAAAYTIPLAAGATRSIELRMPLIPSLTASPEFAAMKKASFTEAEARVTQFWRATLSRGMQIELPERKAVDTFNASLVYDLLARNMVDGKFVQTVNQEQYHRFYLRDSADFVRMYDATGYSDIGDQVIRFFAERQQPDGNFLSQPQQFDGWGEALWAFGEHYRRTHDKAFAEEMYPRIVKAVDWFEKARSTDPLHIMPASDVRDNEYVAGHLTGYNFLALDGLQAAIDLARDLGHPEDAARFEREYQDFHSTFFSVLSKAVASNGGRLPPSVDVAAPGAWKGTDWGNLLSITPEPLLDPWDPRVTATLRDAQSRYREGITSYEEPDDGVFLHHYLTIKNTLTELVRGEQEQAMREFYAELLHTSSTQAGFEYAIRPWGSRDFEGNLAPHGWFAADFRNLLRNMMVREDHASIHLLSAVSPEWVGPGKTIRITDAPTYFGTVSFALSTTSDTSAVLRLQVHSPAGKSMPASTAADVVLHLPWFLVDPHATVSGRTLAIDHGAVRFPAATREVRLTWSRRLPVAMSYDRTVRSYEAEYRRHYDELMQSGKMFSGLDSWRVPE